MAEVTALGAAWAVPTVESIYRDESARLFRSLVGAFGDRHVAEEAVAESFALRPSSSWPTVWWS